MVETRIDIERTSSNDGGAGGFNCYVWQEDVKNGREFHITDVHWSADAEHDPVFLLPDSEVDGIIDDLWREGVRPRVCFLGRLKFLLGG